ncbi:hypothetical protein GCM10009837_07500 [Streptomyces durmitorensis]|uniref:DksA C4-type domain-containing protein n=1 Tax=Streptomyces durmitorensis TaxID=319947 RepID=A0ABY4PMJ9_9ACTN|nr:hypothetical protein [Streptomyces durmitorensis]UQT54359.1 hypothetical protein M4V62_04250 [Streptomyces durmitorensis]
MSERKTLEEIRAELADDAEGCEACADYGQCIDHGDDYLDDVAERIFREQDVPRAEGAP